MTPDEAMRMDRRRTIQLVGTSGVLALAGCLGDDDDDAAEPTPTPEDEDTPTATPDEGEDDLESLNPAPTGDALSSENIGALLEVFDDQPFNDDQFMIDGENGTYTPRHVWKFVSDDSLIGLHFDEPNPEEATAMDYITVAVKGAFTEESKPGEEFTHFHQHTAEDWEGGHGGDTGDEGYWLTHIAVDEIQYPFHGDTISPRVDYEFMPTPVEEGTEGTADFESPGGDEGSLSADDRDALLEIFDARPFNDDQLMVDGEFTPRHIWLWLNEDVAAFLHFDEPDPREATELDYFGIGVRGQFEADSVPAGQEEEFTHFHKWEAEDWEGGHGAQDSDQHGYWLVHHAVREVEYPFHDEPIGVGIDRDFMPTPP